MYPVNAYIIPGLKDKDKIVLTFEEVVKIVADEFGIRPEMMQIKSRKREIVKPRQIAQAMVHRFLKISQAETGGRLGGKDHATVIHACRLVDDLVEDKLYGPIIARIKLKIKRENAKKFINLN